MRSPQISVQSTWASRQMIKGLLSESSHEHSLHSAHTTPTGTSPPADRAQEASAEWLLFVFIEL